MFFTDFVLNGQGHGQVGEALGGSRFDPGFFRPYFNRRGQRCVTLNTGRMAYNPQTRRAEPQYAEVPIPELERRGIYSPLFNAASLRKDEWIEMDRVVVRAARGRLKAWDDLAGAATYGGFNGMAKTTLEYEAMSDPGSAQVDMDGIVPGRQDSPLYQLRSIPLPITHADFWISRRRLETSRNGGMPIDTTMAESCGRRIGEMLEKTLIGIQPGIQMGPTAASDARYSNTSKVYGYTNLPQRITMTTLHNPTTGGWSPSNTIADVIAMRETMYAHNFFGPFVLYNTPSWDAFLDSDYTLTGGNVTTQTLRQRLEAIDGIQAVRRLDFWAPDAANNPGLPYSATPGGAYQFLLVQLLPETARAIEGMPITTIQWESQGGMRINFKVMCIMLPQLRYDINGVAAITHATTS